MKMLPKGLYGCEMAPIHESALRQFRTATANAVTYVTKQRSVDLTFAVASKGEDLDPEVYITTKRITALRRARGKKGSNKEIIDKILKEHRKKKEPGTAEEIEDYHGNK